MMHRPGGEGGMGVGEGRESGRDEGDAERERNQRQEEEKKILTGEELEDAGDGEPLSFAEGEELSHKHKDAQDGEYTSKYRAGLHCLEVICRGSQREGNTMKMCSD